MSVINSTYPLATPPEVPLHDLVLSAIEQHIKNGKNKIAFINGDNDKQKISYEQLYECSYKIATYLHGIQFGLKDIACVVLPNCWQYAALFLGVGRSGGAISGASALFTDYELQRQFADSKAKLVVTIEDFLPKVLKAVEQSPTVEKILVIQRGTNGTYPSNVITWDQVMSTKANFHLPKPRIYIHTDLAVLPYSSGTTGPPKGVMLTHFNFGMMINIYRQHDKTNNSVVLDPNWDYYKEKLLLFLPFYHVFGFGLLIHCLIEGSTGVILSHFEPNNFCAALQNYKPRMLMLVPPILVFLAKHPICAKYDLSSVQLIICGAAPAGKDIVEEIARKYPNIKHIQQGYGMTESSMSSHIPDLKHVQPFGSVGKIASNLQMKIVDPSTAKRMNIGERGEICVKGPTVMKGYLGRPEATNNTVRDGWLHTGDIGYVDKDGNLFIVDRLKELIKVKGLQVAPAELEDLLLSHPRVRDAAVIGIPDAKAGELPRAYVVRADEKLSAQEVADFVKAKVSPYKQLAGGVEFVPEIPKSAAGKILRRMLKDKALAKL